MPSASVTFTMIFLASGSVGTFMVTWVSLVRGGSSFGFAGACKSPSGMPSLLASGRTITGCHADSVIGALVAVTLASVRSGNFLPSLVALMM